MQSASRKRLAEQASPSKRLREDPEKESDHLEEAKRGAIAGQGMAASGVAALDKCGEEQRSAGSSAQDPAPAAAQADEAQHRHLVSIITPCHNATAFLAEMLASIEAQTHRPLELCFW
jgi:hypothetical protein